MPVARPPADLLTRALDLVELGADDAVVAVLDRSLVIAWLSPAWARFALENHGEEALSRFGVGTRYLDGLAEPLRGFFRSVFENVLRTGAPYEQEYECSSPQVFRLHHQRVLPIGGDGLLVEHSPVVVRAHTREAVASDEAAFRDERGLVLQCSNCRRVRRPGDGWAWVPAWVERMPDRTSHGLCGPCAAIYWGVPRRAPKSERSQ